MKSTLLVFGLIFLVRAITVHDSVSNLKSIGMYDGQASDWKASEGGVYVNADLTYLHLPVAPYYVHTSIFCSAGCSEFSGQNSLYNLTKDGFRVYLYNTEGP